MRGVARFALAPFALLLLGPTHAGSLMPTQLERLAFQSLMMRTDLEDSRLGLRMLFQQFPADESACDYVAERLLKEPAPKNGEAADAIAWYVRILHESCPPRYHDVFVLAHQRYTQDKIVKFLDLALATPPNDSVPQYAEGSVDLLARQIDVEQQLMAAQRGGAHGVSMVGTGMALGDVLAVAGMPRDFSSLDIRIARWGQASVLAVHYDGSSMMIFRRDATRNRWMLADRFPELYPVSASYQGAQFATAQSLACLRGLPFRDFIKSNGRAIREDPRLMWAVANRLSSTPVPADEYEEDGMIVGMKWIVVSRHPESLAMLKKIAASPGDKLPKLAGEYVEKLEVNAAKRAARAPEGEGNL